MHHSMRISMPTDISKNEKNPWKMMQLPDILDMMNKSYKTLSLLESQQKIFCVRMPDFRSF